MKNDQLTYHYQPTPNTTWAVEMYGIVLFDTHTEDSCILSYPKAAIWDLITRDYSYPQLVSMLCAIASLQPDDAEKLLAESLEKLTESGFLTRGRDDGEYFNHQ